jgi:putative transposase
MGTYAHYLHEAAAKFGLAIHGWVFMTNHVHLLVTPEQDNSLSLGMQYIGRHYVRYFNQTYRRTGTLFEGRFKSCIVQQSTYFLLCLRYIELNPVRAGMVADPADYRWSSYAAHGFGRVSKLWTPHPLYLGLGDTDSERRARYRSLFEAHIEGEMLLEVRQSVNRGLALGTERFKQEVEDLGGRRQHLLKRGPQPGTEYRRFGV